MARPAVVDEITLAGGDRGCLLLHGFTGTPLEMVPLAEALARDGIAVHVARLAGHGTSPEDLAETTWEDWVASARQALARLRARCGSVAVGGLSMGGALALLLAATDAPAAAVALATPIRLRPVVRGVVRAARPVLRYAPVLRRVGPRSAEVAPYRAAYPRIPLGAVDALSALLDQMRARLPQVRCPVLIAQGRRDWAIPPESAAAICDGVAAPVRRLVWLPRSGHLVTLDRDRDVLFREVRAFLAAHLRAAG
ncbi:MAG: alpha/beta fold hydrolase [Armatimonadota bacterium]|nr:alpha/beta fold hydrolase [Armatimonadota bacterium]MDR7533613.1 alpha/beta fold hydrolase [Armatimonadota bacterium]MDR7537331.1 alpha/beta fold hydrolase [Armatimonadota bacterium]